MTTVGIVSGGEGRRVLRFTLCAFGHRWEPFELREETAGLVAVMSGRRCWRCEAWRATTVSYLRGGE